MPSEREGTEQRQDVAPLIVCGPTCGCGQTFAMVLAPDVYPPSWTLPERVVVAQARVGMDGGVARGACGQRVATAQARRRQGCTAAVGDRCARLQRTPHHTGGNMIVGFTGTQTGMTPDQERVVRRLLDELRPESVEHGDCIGADAQFDRIATVGAGVRHVILRPGHGRNGTTMKRACCHQTTPQLFDAAATTVYSVYTPEPYLIRDDKIVADCDVLIAAPVSTEEQVRSGTWTTVRRARVRNKRVYIVYPNGTVERRGPHATLL